jgi:hypothetical protein
MSTIKEQLVQCDYCNQVCMHTKSYPCTRPSTRDHSILEDYHICEICLKEQFYEEKEYGKEKEERSEVKQCGLR